jgi:hypothetical protein
MSEFTGYPIESEDREYIAGLPNESPVLAMRGTYTEVRLDPRVLIPVENQKALGSCAGHSLSSILEWCYCIGTAGQTIQLSRAMAYFATQEIDGIRGDSGSTVSGGAKLATTKGVCREVLWPYPTRYDARWPQDRDAVLADAAKHKVETVTRITSYEGFRTFLGAGLGGIHTGISWGNSMNKAVVETFSAGGGGHSICGLCLSERLDSKGEPYCWIQNSWSESFGNKGWQEWSPTAIRQMLRHPHTAFIGLSDMKGLAPRELNVAQWQEGLRV